MTWVRLDDGFDEHPKIDALTDQAFRLHVAGLCYSARTLSDGHIPAHKATRLTATTKARHVQELLDAGCWTAVEGGYLIHDYLDYQRSRADILHEREAARARVQRHRARNGVTNADSNADRTDAPSRPDPSTELSSSSDTTTVASQPEEDDRVSRAITAVVQRRLQRASGIQRPTAWAATTERQLRLEEDAAGHAADLIADYPDLTDGQLVDVLDGNTSVLRFLQRRGEAS